MSAPLLKLTDLRRHYRLPRTSLLRPGASLSVLDGVSLELQAGGSLGLVGASGSGKSTLARLVMALERPDNGTVELQGRDLNRLSPRELLEARRDLAIVFQDPAGALDPRMTVERSVAEPLELLERMPRPMRRERVLEMLEAVGLSAADLGKYPHQFSGGQRQRIAIARALVTRPRLIVADEPVSALDMSVQAQVLNLLQDLRQRFGMALLLISHDLAVVAQLCEQLAVLQAGRIVEQGPLEELLVAPQQAYTRELLTGL
ncbi:dipeptide/oligopeptide/nickel ABC transporter ATP-binding protein [Pelomonas sp. SE-A7]|uniref:ATP-binding cassette domain-containing protein n=1 Tax=Pelomonas sp. SE-A7 TaxID=3054953 RepID=UPI00259C93C8|nr:dipeptide/oligopeptide/nickel ABC transporter ATP-binding protein [Pelomonas sp. SE-A7]MDM4768183.1 dipeptide/oligopeptide/nickel ABC transporter ATP-binding protein [Pelomonas sp. SE-A7]